MENGSLKEKHGFRVYRRFIRWTTCLSNFSGLVLILAIRNLLNCKHFLVISQSPQRSQSFLIFLCVLCGLCERSNALVMTMPNFSHMYV